MCVTYMYEQDPCRPGVIDAVRLCTEAGVKASTFPLLRDNVFSFVAIPSNIFMWIER